MFAVVWPCSGFCPPPSRKIWRVSPATTCTLIFSTWAAGLCGGRGVLLNTNAEANQTGDSSRFPWSLFDTQRFCLRRKRKRESQGGRDLSCVVNLSLSLSLSLSPSPRKPRALLVHVCTPSRLFSSVYLSTAVSTEVVHKSVPVLVFPLFCFFWPCGTQLIRGKNATQE